MVFQNERFIGKSKNTTSINKIGTESSIDHHFQKHKSKMNKSTKTLLLLAFPLLLLAQNTQPPFTPALERSKGYEQRKVLTESSLVANVPFQNIGPTVFSGRVSDIDVWEKDPTHFYVAYASGGLWKTENNGQSFTPIFDHEMVMTIGDIAVNWNRSIIWVGTGEVNSSRSSYAGNGIYRSDNGGKTWQHMGLEESHHIGAIILHPKDPNTIWVAALGHLYSPNQERGIYKTTDGGRTWKKVLFVDANTGAVELAIDPSNTKILYAAMWERERRAWDFTESGKGSGIYKSTNGGESWTKMNTPASGFPADAGVGRIGLATVRHNNKTLVYAVLDNQNRRPKEAEKEVKDILTKDMLRSMSKDDFLKLGKDKVEAYMQENFFPRKYKAEQVIDMVKNDKIKPAALVEYLENANSLMFDTDVIGAEVYVSGDDGVTWKRTHQGYLDDVYSSYGYYFGKIHAAAQDPNEVYIYGVPIIASKDGGKTWKSIDGANVHSDHHALWINPNRAGHLIDGNDGGINISYDFGKTWIKCNSPAVGQFYYVAVDMEQPYNVYGGLQDNGVWYGPKTYRASDRWHGTGQYPYKGIYGGDGMQVAIDTRNNNILYTGSQFGSYSRIDKAAAKSDRITPSHELGERPFRWNWQTPIHLSSHNQDILYMASERVHRSLNQGKDWTAISGDLTKGGKKGDVPYGTITTIHESPLQFGLLYAGTDDGLVHVSKDGGTTWHNISKGLPENMWISRVQASAFEKSRVYVSLNGYRWDDFRPLIFLSEDYGQTWNRIGTDLPIEPVNVIKEDPKNANLLYVGTDHGLYISLNRGKSFMHMNKDLPAVPVHDLVIHPRDNELVVGTHGRSIYLADVQHVQLLVDSILNKSVYAFEIAKIRYRPGWGNARGMWSEQIPEANVSFPFFLSNSGKVKISVYSENLQLFSTEKEWPKGINYFNYSGEMDATSLGDYEKALNSKKRPNEKEIKVEKAKNGKYYIQRGVFTVVYEKDGQKVERKLTVEQP